MASIPDFGLSMRLLHQISGQLGIELRFEDVQGVHSLLKQAGGHDHIGIHGPVRDAQTAGQHPPPALRLPAGILIADDHGRAYFRQQRLQGILRRPAHDEPDLPLLQILFDVDQALVQKGVMAPVGMGKIGDGREVDQYRQIERVAHLDRDIERGIIQSSFRPLHPVDNAFCIWREGPASANTNPGIGGDRL